MSISSKNVICTKTQKVRKCKQITTNQNHTNQPDDPQIPRQICVSSKKNSKPDTQKRQEPKQKHPQKGFAKGHSGLTTASRSKTCRNELSTTKFSETWKSKHRAYLRKHRRKELYMVTGLQNCLPQRPLRCACAEGHNVKDLNRLSSVGKNVAVVIVPSTPRRGACGSGVQEDSQDTENHPYSHRKT